VDLSASGDTLTLELSDTGIGIEADLLPHIFRTFRQSKQSLDRAEGGLGLGLALVKWLVELHGGSVAANSEGRGRGSSFVVRLPASAPPVRSRAAFSGRAQTGARLLVIEDDPDAAEMLRQLLELAGHEVDVAGTGPEGIALARKVTPDVVLCDLGLPDGMSGFDVARALRSDPATKCSGLVALSGYGRPEDKAEGVDAGFDAHLTKPVDLDALGKVIDDLRTDATSARRLAGHDAEAH
jgi:two-component system CheB/CheR fusion protein